ncbi:MAG: hypothetical protein ACO1RX_01540 [Candidatus Sericytochromatia bacterium]
MGVGDLSFAAVASLKSVDSWIATLNSNMAGAGRVGYKASRVKFDGGAVSIDRPVVSPRLGVAIAEQSLGIAQTSIDFSQGAIAASTDFTHLGIQRTTASPALFVLNSEADGSGTEYYTFDGEFHLNSTGELINSQGLYVMSADGDAVSADPLGDFDIQNDQIALDRLQLAVVANPQLTLRFSRYGATIYEQIPGSTAPVITNPDNIGNYATAAGSGRVIPNALEASNASLTSAVPELALAQKIYAAIAKVITVALSNIDVALALGPR